MFLHTKGLPKPFTGVSDGGAEATDRDKKTRVSDEGFGLFPGEGREQWLFFRFQVSISGFRFLEARMFRCNL